MTGAMIRFCAVALATVVLSACTQVTMENYDRLRVGMRYEEVKAILGAPTQCSDVLVMRTCTWGSERRYISVSFVSDQVVVFHAENIR